MICAQNSKDSRSSLCPKHSAVLKLILSPFFLQIEVAGDAGGLGDMMRTAGGDSGCKCHYFSRLVAAGVELCVGNAEVCSA